MPLHSRKIGKLSLAIVAILALLLVVTTGCAKAKIEQPEIQEPKTQLTPTKTYYPLTFKDDSGTTITFQKTPERIVSFVPSSTETLYALGLDKHVVGVTMWDNYPENVQNNAEYVFQDSLHPNIEQLIRLKPDLIVLGVHDSQTVTSIRNLKIPTIIINPQNIEATYKAINDFGLVTDKQERAKEIVENMRKKETEIVHGVSRVANDKKAKVWIEVSSELYTAGKGTFMDELVEKAGGINIANIDGWAQYSSEQVIAQNPQVILETYGYYDKDAVKKIKNRAGWDSIDAVKNMRIIELNSDIVNRPGPRIIEGLQSIAKALYPDIF